MLKIIGTNIFLTKGDSASIELTPIYFDGTPYEPQSGDIVRCQIRVSPDKGTLIGSWIIGKNSEDKFIWNILPEDTSSTDSGDYYWDAQLETGQDVFTFIPVSRFRLLSEVTTNA